MARKSTKTLAALAVGLTPGIVVLTGCGGGSGHSAITSPGQSSERGVLTLKVTFPKRNSRTTKTNSRRARVSRPVAPGYDGSIPQGTQSVKVTLVNPTTGAPLALPQIIQAPLDDETGEVGNVDSPQTVSFSNLAVGPVRVQVLAFPTLLADAATGPGENNPIATGTADAQILANQTTTAQVLLHLTLDHIELTPKNTTLTVFQGQTSAVLTAQAFDKNNAPLLYPFTFATSDSNVALITPLDAHTVEVDANNAGTATITATEVNSHMMTTASVTVVNGP